MIPIRLRVKWYALQSSCKKEFPNNWEKGSARSLKASGHHLRPIIRRRTKSELLVTCVARAGSESRLAAFNVHERK